MVAQRDDVREAANSPAEPNVSVVRTRIELPTSTIVKVILTLVVLWLLVQLWDLLLLLFIAFLLATALAPLARTLERRGWPRAGAVGTIFVGLLAVTALVLLLLVPPLIQQGEEFAEELPTYVEQGRVVLEANPDLFERVQEAAAGGTANPGELFTGVLAFGAGLVTGIANLFIVLVLTVYLLLDGERIYNWVSRYLPPSQRVKVRRAMPEIGHVVSGYVVGQSINSTLFGVYSFIVLSVVGVPQALLLAIVAAIADAIPLAGVFIATIPAVLVALTVSVPAAVIVFVLYMVYQQIENYVIVPRVFRNTLRISSFTVLVAVLVGGKLLGIIGVILALPIAAAIPVIERIWGVESAAPPGAAATRAPGPLLPGENDAQER